MKCNPDISIIIPCRNEAMNVETILCDIAAAAPSNLEIEVLFADGQSTDGSITAIRSAVQKHNFKFPVKILENEKLIIPAALNLLAANANGDYIIRIDCHSRLSSNYLTEIYDAIRNSVGDVVGPRVLQIASSDSLVARVIAELLNSRFGNGGTPSRNRQLRPVEVTHTVMSCYRRVIWEKIGGYDESLLANEDFDFDFRAHRFGYRVVSLPTPIFMLKARSTLGGLLKQRFRYGFWKAKVLKKHPDSLSVRQLIPAILPLCALLLVPYPKLLGAMIISYAVVATISAYRAANSIVEKLITPFCASTVAFVIHFFWAFGLYIGFLFKRRNVI